jgi:hypothetical protein
MQGNCAGVKKPAGWPPSEGAHKRGGRDSQGRDDVASQAPQLTFSSRLRMPNADFLVSVCHVAKKDSHVTKQGA